MWKDYYTDPEPDDINWPERNGETAYAELIKTVALVMLKPE